MPQYVSLIEKFVNIALHWFYCNMHKLRISPVTSILRNQYKLHQKLCSTSEVSEEEKEREIERISRNASLDDPPTACCRSGCANCVFIVWAEALAAKMENAGPEISEKIMKLVDDPSMRAYLEMELRLRLKKS